ncbi:MAG: glycosyltransferase family 2 protein [Prosthecobacter sp.]
MFSQAQEVAHFLDQQKRRRHVCCIIYLVLLAGYLVWRTTIFNPEQRLLSVLFYAADIFGAIQGAFFVLTSWDVRRRPPAPTDHRPTVDVFLPVYTEPAEMIELTVIGAVGIDYPHQTFLLDDGRRPELKEIAERHGAIYVTRPDNKGAKAGNLNHALKLSKAEALATFDADHIAKREALNILVGHLKDPTVAVSQAPQMFYNEDGFLYRDVIVGCGRWHEQAHFMNVSQANRDFFGGSTCIGSGCVYNRKALDDIGGFPEATLTEDFHSAILFHKKGYQTVWVNEPVAWGVAAADISEFYKTRRRWTYGNLQAFALEKLLFGGGLSFKRWVSYMNLAIDLVAGWFQFIYVVVPLLSMLAGINGFMPTTANTIMLVCFPGLLVLMLNLGCGGYVRFLPGQIFSMGRMFMQMECTRGLFGRKMKWQISLKNVLGSIQYGKLAAHILMLLGSVAGVLYTTLKMVGIIPNPNPMPGGTAVMAMAMFWVLLNCWRSWRWITDSVRLTKQTHREYLFEAPVPVLDEKGTWIGSATRLSTKQMEACWHAGARVPLAGETLQLLIPGHVVRMVVQQGGGAGLLEMAPANENSWNLLRRSLYSVDWHRMVKLSPHSHMARQRGLAGEWEPAVLRVDDQPRWALVLRGGSEAAGHRLMLEGTPPALGSLIQLLTLNDLKPELKKWLVKNQVSPACNVPCGLNNSQFSFFEIGIA